MSNWNTMASYPALDPGFDAKMLINKLSALYVLMQNCWSAKNLTPLRPYFTDAQYAQYDRQLDSGYRQAGLTSHIENIAVLGVTLDRWQVSGDNDEIVATVQARLTQYTTDDKSGRLVRGSRTAKKYMTYEWTLSRKHGVTTTAGTRTICCPHCNAPLEINRTARCEYCGSVVTVDSVDWVISNIKGIAQRTEGR